MKAKNHFDVQMVFPDGASLRWQSRRAKRDAKPYPALTLIEMRDELHKILDQIQDQITRQATGELLAISLRSRKNRRQKQ